MDRSIGRIRLVTLIAAVFGLAIAPVAQAGPEAQSSAALSKKVKKLKQQLAALQSQVDSIQLQPGPKGAKGDAGSQGAPGLSTGPASGDLTGSYPDPDVAPDAVALGADTTGDYVQSVGNGTGITGAGAAGEGTTPNIGLDYGATLPGNPTLGSGQSVFSSAGGGGVLFEGSNGTADPSESLLTVANPTADRTITLPDASGTVSVSGQPGSFSNVTINSGAPITAHNVGTLLNLASNSIPANACGNYFTLTFGAIDPNHTVHVLPLAASSANGIEDNNLSWNAVVSADDTAIIRACNPTGAAIDTANDQEWRIAVWGS